MRRSGKNNGKLLHSLLPNYFVDHNQTPSNMVLEGGSPGPESTQQDTREEQRRISKSSNNYDAGRTKTNKTIFERIKPKTSLEGKITKQRLSYFGHIMRDNSLETTLMPSMVSRRRKRGSQRTRWMDTIKTDTNLHMKEAVRDRKT